MITHRIKTAFPDHADRSDWTETQFGGLTHVTQALATAYIVPAIKGEKWATSYDAIYKPHILRDQQPNKVSRIASTFNIPESKVLSSYNEWKTYPSISKFMENIA